MIILRPEMAVRFPIDYSNRRCRQYHGYAVDWNKLTRGVYESFQLQSSICLFINGPQESSVNILTSSQICEGFFNKGDGMTNGSEKQIKWAEEIKKNAVDYFEKGLTKEKSNRERAIEREKTNLTGYDTRIEDYENILESLNNKTDAEWFIDNRSITTGSIPWDVLIMKITGQESAWVKYQLAKRAC